MEGMDHLVKVVTEMKHAMDLIEGHNGNSKNYCDSLIERADALSNKIQQIYPIQRDYEESLQMQQNLIRTLEETKNRLLYLQDKKFPKLTFEQDNTKAEYNLLNELSNLEISTSNEKIREQLTFQQVSDQHQVSNTFEDSLCSVNATFVKRDTVPCISKASSNLEIHVSYISSEEFSQIASYMRGRVTIKDINDFINIFNITLNKKYDLLKKNKKKKSKPELEQCLIWKNQETGELQNAYFCNAEDFDKLGNIKIGHKKFMNIITILRHVKRIKEVRNMKMTYYVACF